MRLSFSGINNKFSRNTILNNNVNFNLKKNFTKKKIITNKKKFINNNLDTIFENSKELDSETSSPSIKSEKIEKSVSFDENLVAIETSLQESIDESEEKSIDEYEEKSIDEPEKESIDESEKKIIDEPEEELIEIPLDEPSIEEDIKEQKEKLGESKKRKRGRPKKVAV